MVDYVDTLAQGQQPRYDTYWQSITWWDVWNPNLVPLSANQPPQVNITIDFDQEYTLQNDLIIFFNSSRPQKMTLYKSSDYGVTYEPWEYYDTNCDALYSSGLATGTATVTNPTVTLCLSDYADSRPYSGGETRLSVEQRRFSLFAGADIQNYQRLYEAFETTDLIKWLTFTNLIIALEYPASVSNVLNGEKKDLVRSWYAIQDIQLVTA